MQEHFCAIPWEMGYDWRMNIVVCTDLIFSTKITGPGKGGRRPSGGARAMERVGLFWVAGAEGGGGRAGVIVDLNAGLARGGGVRVARGDAGGGGVVAFLSHVQAEFAAAAG